MKTKQQVIKEAYGQNWNNVKEHIDENGWLNVDDFYLISQGKLNFTQIETKEEGLIFQNHRPVSLSGLESNNGWTKIESEDDLPNYQGTIILIKKDEEEYETQFFNYLKNGEKEEFAKIYSHYRLFPEFESPIY